MAGRRLVFVEETSMREFSGFAEEQGWSSEEVSIDLDGDIDEDRPMLRWEAASGSVCFIDDSIIRCQYVQVESVADEEQIRASFVCFDREEAVRSLDLGAGQGAVRRGFRLIACTAVGAFDDAVFATTIRGLGDDRPHVRKSALIVPQYTSWSEFLPEIIRLDEGDPDLDVRETAGGIRMLLELAAQLADG
ncbi:hypothetical protein GCM10027280_61690 [Micromonospora polyrhachis]|uniref:Uncharacterized protein n=1 Tax=Micromonospora polyrhachis TaxID=1282883 RepID=A0A7W7WSS0_9ACTN|nr:hypothetical protein [Micromonospora polyrhachis]MBB4962435.1 hypothetical protein [Micromonospora polyrhachis]